MKPFPDKSKVVKSVVEPAIAPGTAPEKLLSERSIVTALLNGPNEVESSPESPLSFRSRVSMFVNCPYAAGAPPLKVLPVMTMDVRPGMRLKLSGSVPFSARPPELWMLIVVSERICETSWGRGPLRRLLSNSKRSRFPFASQIVSAEELYQSQMGSVVEIQLLLFLQFAPSVLKYKVAIPNLASCVTSDIVSTPGFSANHSRAWY
mmetsp:Transcript_21212/g.58716  ORF Transcript_21212/g.58716 Transcript_21212/m.58716 type:complete len:206 (+) Transcript_21212:581-1198(+)